MRLIYVEVAAVSSETSVRSHRLSPTFLYTVVFHRDGLIKEFSHTEPGDNKVSLAKLQCVFLIVCELNKRQMTIWQLLNIFRMIVVTVINTEGPCLTT